MKTIFSETHRLHDPSCGHDAAHPEIPERAEQILSSIREAGHDVLSPDTFDREAIQTVHTPDYFEYLSGAFERWVAAGQSPCGVVPCASPFPAGGDEPDDIVGQAGRYCFDISTPIVKHSFEAACASACCALTGADLLLNGEPSAYALCRPPGHHAGRGYCGGFCYFNNVALAATRLAGETGKECEVAVLDVDYHHGNGTQEIFYESDRVLYVSIHADPHFVFPYRWGFSHETGAGPGDGLNVNFPLAPNVDRQTYLDTLTRALEVIAGFDARFLAVSLGVDTYVYDPLGTFELTEDTFAEIGTRVSQLGLPTLVVQEGGYNLDHMGRCVTNFLAAFDRG